jgi:hypothetical protein
MITERTDVIICLVGGSVVGSDKVVKLCLIGDSGVGKSCLLTRWTVFIAAVAIAKRSPRDIAPIRPPSLMMSLLPSHSYVLYALVSFVPALQQDSMFNESHIATVGLDFVSLPPLHFYHVHPTHDVNATLFILM